MDRIEGVAKLEIENRTETSTDFFPADVDKGGGSRTLARFPCGMVAPVRSLYWAAAKALLTPCGHVPTLVRKVKPRPEPTRTHTTLCKKLGPRAKAQAKDLQLHDR